MDNSDNRTVESAAGWSLITELLSKLISPVISIILARLLAPEAFGIVATISLVTSFAEVFTDAGFQKFIVQHEYENDWEYKTSFSVAFWSNFFLSALIFILIVTFRKQLAGIVGSPELSSALVASAIPIIINSYSSLQLAAYRRAFDFKKLFFFRMVVALVPVVVTVPLAFALKSFWALIVGGVTQSVFQFLILLIKPKIKIKFFYSAKLFNQMFSFSFWTLLESVSIWLTANADIFIVGRVLNDYYLGLYKTSMTTVNGYMNVISGAVIPVLFSALSRVQNNDDEFKNTYFRFQRLLAIVLIPMGLGLFLFRDFATYILLGTKWMEASDFIGLYSLSCAFKICICFFASEVFRSKGQPKVSMLYQLLNIIVMIPAIYYASNQGFEILFVVRTSLIIVLLLSAFIFVQVLYDIKVLDIVKNLFPQTFSALVMFAFGFTLMQISDSIVWHIADIFFCTIVYFLILFLFGNIRREVFKLEFIKKIFRCIKR